MFSKEDFAYMATLDERQRRLYKASVALHKMEEGQSMCKITKKMRTSKNTLYKGISELRNPRDDGDGRIRRPGGGRKDTLARHPEWVELFLSVTNPYKAGLPQDGNVYWISLSVPQIRRKMNDKTEGITDCFVRRILAMLGFRRRSFMKDLPMKDCVDRDAQFVHIAEVRDRCLEIGLPAISIDTKKKELIGNFRRDGKTLSVGTPKSLDHDFKTFSEGRIVPHGIYDIARNEGYMTIGTSHDTSGFVCDNIERVWLSHLRPLYPDARTLVVLCDGGGSNSSSHRIVKNDLMELSERIDMNILVMHYPPYCSKFNPIEHRLFSQITRSWKGAPLLSVEDAARRAAETTTVKGLKVHVDIIKKDYELKRTVGHDYERKLRRNVVFDPNLPKWNYLIKCPNLSHVIFL